VHQSQVIKNINVAEDTPTGITLSAVDVDGNAITFTLLSSPTHGTLTGTIPNLIYTPSLNYNGPDSLHSRPMMVQ